MALAKEPCSAPLRPRTSTVGCAWPLARAALSIDSFSAWPLDKLRQARTTATQARRWQRFRAGARQRALQASGWAGGDLRVVRCGAASLPASHTAMRSLTVRSALRQGKGRLPADAAGGARDNADQAAGGAAHQLQGRHIPHPQLLHGMRGACGSPAAAAPRRSRLITPTCRKTSTPTLANSRQYLIASMVNGGQSETQ